MSAYTTTAPESRLYRNATAADGAVTDKRQGLNCSGYDTVHFEIIAAGGGNPACELLFWSEGAQKFVSDATPVVIAAGGVNSSRVFSYPVKGRTVFMSVTTLAAGSVAIYASGFRSNTDF